MYPSICEAGVAYVVMSFFFFIAMFYCGCGKVWSACFGGSGFLSRDNCARAVAVPSLLFSLFLVCVALSLAGLTFLNLLLTAC